MEQKFVYTGEGAEAFYRSSGGNKDLPFYDNVFQNFLLKHLNFTTSSKVAFLSLGCGDAYKEKSMFEGMQEYLQQINYYGIDFSREMLNIATANLIDFDIEKKYIYGDFTKSSFNKDISKFLKAYDQKLFLLLGSTFGNPNQTLITDSLYNLLGEKDLLWMDVLSRKDDSQSTIMKVFNRYKSYIQDERHVTTMFSPLKKIGIPFDSGEIVLETYNEASVGAIVFSFSFVFNAKVVGEFIGEKFHILPKEKIHLLNIRNYNKITLENFMKEHEFQLKDSMENVVSEDLKRLQLLRTVNK